MNITEEPINEINDILEKNIELGEELKRTIKFNRNIFYILLTTEMIFMILTFKIMGLI